MSEAGRQRILILLLVCTGVLFAFSARAHEFRPATLSLDERRPGLFAVQTTPAVTSLDEQVSIAPIYPSTCRLSDNVLDCGEGGLDGTIAFEGLTRESLRVVVHIEFESGAQVLRTVTAESPELLVQGGRRGSAGGRVLRDYLVLGVEHILAGYDHLLFVALLIMMAGFTRSLVGAITAFTVAHSITLAWTVLLGGSLSPSWVEFMIALSLVLLAREVIRPKGSSLTQRTLWIPAFFYGLLHGMGFSGALQELGIPPYQVVPALAGFNAGVELGQLSLVLALWGLTSLIPWTKWRDAQDWKWAASTLAGIVGAYLCIDRGWALLSN